MVWRLSPVISCLHFVGVTLTCCVLFHFLSLSLPRLCDCLDLFHLSLISSLGCQSIASLVCSWFSSVFLLPPSFLLQFVLPAWFYFWNRFMLLKLTFPYIHLPAQSLACWSFLQWHIWRWWYVRFVQTAPLPPSDHKTKKKNNNNEASNWLISSVIMKTKVSKINIQTTC